MDGAYGETPNLELIHINAWALRMAQLLEKAERRAMLNAEALWQLAAWYREFAERTGNPIIWEGRLRTAEALEVEAAEIASRSVPDALEAVSDPPAEAPVQRERMIRERAYALWQEEGRPDGRSVAHWLQAEAEIDQQRTRIPVHYHAGPLP